MDPKQLQNYLDNPETASQWMQDIGITNPLCGMRNLKSISSLDPSLEVTGPLIDHLSPLLRWTADPDMVLNNLERFFQATRSPKTLGSLFLQDRMALPMLLEIFAASQYLGDMLINEPELFETIRQSDGIMKTQSQLADELLGEITNLEKDAAVLRAIRRFKRRQTLRIAFEDIIRKQSLEVVTRQISRVAEAITEAAILAAGRTLFRKRGTPRSMDGAMAHFTILAMGKLGGGELNYSSDIDLIFLYDSEGHTDPNQERIDNSQYFSELGREIVRILAEPTELGAAYRVDMRLRPNGKHGTLAIGFEEALRYYDHRGRTWERQAFIKARPIAGNILLGQEFLRRLQPWIYRRHLTQADIAGIRTLKHRIERNAQAAGDELLNVKTGYGGIRDIEFMTQFLQLLHGGELPELRIGNTLQAIDRLEKCGCLRPQEKDLLFEGYRFLRKIEHRLQIMFDLQTHVMPDATAERRKLALRMGYNDMDWRKAEEAFDADFKYMTNTNRRMLNHLMVHAFHDNEQIAPEVDLLLDPEPEQERIDSTLAKFAFADTRKAYNMLCDLMDEKNPYLSARRCRHFLVAIAPEMLREIAVTPNPDQTLVTLTSVADASGEKGGLWELFSFNPPSLKLFVRICAYAPFLADMLCRDPGMLDGLMDSLVLNKVHERKILDEYLTELCTNAELIEPILSGFKNDHILPIGTRDILGMSDVRETTAAISDIAELCLKQVVVSEYRRLLHKHGTPSLLLPNNESAAATEISGQFVPCRFAVVALGKLGGREINYRSDLDLMFLFEGSGETRAELFGDDGVLRPLDPTKTKTCPNQEFFNRMVPGIVRRMTMIGAWGKLYEVDLRLRPLGKGGAPAISLDDFLNYFFDGTGEIWERQTLCKARVVFSSDQAAIDKNVANKNSFGQMVDAILWKAQTAEPLGPAGIERIRTMRGRLLDSTSQDQLKRRSGGTIDIEFIVQMLQLKYTVHRSGTRITNTFEAIERLYAEGMLTQQDQQTLSGGYRFLRSLEGFLCIMNHSATRQIPEDEQELQKLAFLAGFGSGHALIERYQQVTEEVAECFDRIFRQEMGGG